MIKHQPIFRVFVILITSFLMTSCGSTDDELKAALEEGAVSSHVRLTVNAGDDQSVTLNETVTLNGDKSSDPNGHPLTYLWDVVSKPPGSSVSLINQTTANPTFTADIEGVYVVRLTVNNGTESRADEVEVTVNAVPGTNTAPVANAGPDITVTVNADVTLNGNGSSDDDGDSLTFLWSFVSRPAGSGAAFNDASSVQSSFKPDVAGSYEIRLTVDDGNNSHTDTLTVTASTGPVPNNAPVAHAGADQSIIPGSTITLSGAGSFDPDNDTLTYLWEIISQPVGSNSSLNDSMLVESRFISDTAGTYEIRLTVDDGEVSQSDSVVITVNTAPVASAGADQAVTLNTLVTLNGSGSSDPDGDTVTCLWVFVSRPGSSMATLTNETTMSPRFTADSAGTFEIRLTVDDGKVSHTDTVRIMVNTVPVANAGDDQSVTLNTTVSLNGSGSSDPDGDAITYRWEFISIPAGSNADFSDQTSETPSFTADMAGTYEIRLTVNDNTTSDADTVSITTLNTVPVAEAGNYANVPYDASIMLDGAGSSDADGDDLNYRWRFLEVPDDSSNVILTDYDTRTPAFITDAYGRYVIELVVNDGHVDSEPDTVEIKTGTVPDTGQTLCINEIYDSYPSCPTDETDPLYGQDGYYTISPPSYTKLGYNGTELLQDATDWIMVRDNVTGLIWEVKTTNGSIHDRDNRYTWYDSNPLTNGGYAGTDGEGTDTEDFIKYLNDNRFGNYTDWRMPTVVELQSIVDYSKGYPAVDTQYFPNIDYQTQKPYWSSTSSVSSQPSSAMWIEFLFGYIENPGSKDIARHVRAVRGVQSVSSFVDNGDGTITDYNTGLMWMKATADTNVDGTIDGDDMVGWEGALNYCKNLKLTGKTDWRLPNIKELITIVNYSHANPAIDTAFFSDTMPDSYWTSTSDWNRYQVTRTVVFETGITGSQYKADGSCYVRAVRGGRQ